MDQNKQTEAVFKSVRTDVDPVSGNEVPTGALPEEVRDDVPAMLSEGEYVVPADVLRYYGVKFFEDLRMQAKMGLTDMEANGRIGGEPVEEELPFSMEELAVVDDGGEEPQGMAKGGYVKGYDEGGLETDPTKMDMSFVNTISPSTESDYKLYKNDQGMTLYVRFVDGNPMTYIPPGYVEAGTASDVTPTENETSVEREESEGGRNETPDVEPVDYSKMSDDELSRAVNQMGMTDIVAQGASALSAPLGAAIGIGGRMQTAAIANELQDRYNNTQEPAEQAKYEEMFNTVTNTEDRGKGIFGGGGIMGGGGTLNDVNESGKSNFGDTFLGDLLGFDNKAGVQGPGLADSFQGARRTGGTGTESSNLSGSSSTSNQSNDDANNDNSGRGLGQGIADALGFDNFGDMFDGGGRGASRDDDDE